MPVSKGSPVRAITRFVYAGIAAVVAAAAVRGVAAAELRAVTVPAITAPQTIDPNAPLSAWPDLPPIALTWDVVHVRGVDADGTIVHVATDASFLYVRFDAAQREPVTATQHSNDTITGGSQGNNGALSWSADDAVWVDLWPTGPNGFAYQFEANPNGSHNESSTENAAFSPEWESHGAIHDGGYTVTMAIPLNVLHGAKSGTWRAQFIRYVRATGAQIVWSFDHAQSSADDVSRAGSLTVTVAAGAAPVPKPRAAIYALGALASGAAGGSTTRTGADISVPITATSAFFATFHPDFSNVELDQQSISPSVYARTYSEVRPFFTQAASYYNRFDCDVCAAYRTILYTPAIPTFADGYAFEGKYGNFGLAAFDAVGDGREDSAGVVNYRSPDSRFSASLQHVTADLPGLYDTSDEIGLNWSNLKYLSGYVNYSTDRGTNVLDPRQGNAFDIGGGFGAPHFAVYASARNVGQYFNPVDGFNSHPGIAGYAVYSARIWEFAPQDKLAAVGISGMVDRNQGPVYGEAQSDNQILFDVLTKSAWDLQVFSGSDYWRFGPTLAPISQSGGFQLTYHSGLQTGNANNFPSHGTSATPTVIAYATGRYGAGRLDTWTRTSTLRLGEKGTLSFIVDDTAQWMPTGPANVQWFDGVSYSYQINRQSSFGVGLREVIGYPPQPNGGGNCEGRCANVSVAYHLRLRHEEFYLAYGNPNTLTTVPQALLKVIFYLGGQKGT